MDHPQRGDQKEGKTRVELTQLWLKSLPVLEAYVASAVTDRHSREDIIQSTAEQASLSFDDYDRSRPFSAWVIGIARYRVLAYYRTLKRERLVFSDCDLDLMAEAVESISAEFDTRTEALEECLTKLSPRHRKLISLRYTEDLKPAKIAERVGISANAVSGMLRRVRLALAECVRRQIKAWGD